MTNSQETRPLTADEQFRTLFDRTAKLNDQMSALLNPEWGASMGILPAGHPLHPDARRAPEATDTGTTAERCCVCGGGPVTYHNYREQPFCNPCANCACDQDVCVRTGINDPAVAASTLRDQMAAILRSLTVIGGTPPRPLVPVMAGDSPPLARIVDWRPLDDVIDALLAVILPATRITVTLARDSEAAVQRVIDLYERWAQGSPPLGTSMAGYLRWWREHLAELHDAILPPEQPNLAQTKEQ